MSGFISALSSAAEAVTGLAALAFGSTGGVVLGDFTFAGFEVPESVPIGGAQSMTVHRLPGGDRVVDLMGDDLADISWSGTFLDGNPEARARQLDQMRSDGMPLPLHFGHSFYTVLIRSLTATVQYGRVGYSIACLVLRDESTAKPAADPDLDSGVAGDLLSAVASAPAVLGPILSTAQTAVSALGTLIPGSPRLAQAFAVLGGAQSALNGLSASAGSALGAISNGASLTSAVVSSGTLAQSLQSAAFVGRAVRNLT